MSDLNGKLSPKVRAKLQEKLLQLKAKSQQEQMQVVKVDAEMVVEGSSSNLPAVQQGRPKPKLMDLATSEQYIEKFIDMTPKQIAEFIDRQSDALMIYSKNAALDFLARAVESGDEEALEMYLKVIQASAIVSQEKLNVKKSLGLSDEEKKPKQYVAEELTQEEWEKTFKPGQPVQPEQLPESKVPDGVYGGIGSKSVN